MTPKALVIDDDPAIIEAVGETLESLGHLYDHAECVVSARELIERGHYEYFLVDLEIPLRAGQGIPRIQNGENLLVEIVRRTERKRPVIVMTSHGKDGPDLAVEVMKKGAVDYVTKPFPLVGYTLDKKISEALARALPLAAPVLVDSVSATEASAEPTQFAGGELLLLADSAILCGVQIMTDRGTGQCLEILRHLATRDSSGRYVRCSAAELAALIRPSRGPEAIFDSIRRIRNNITNRLAKNGIACGGYDVIQNDAMGYSLCDWIVVLNGVREKEQARLKRSG